MEGEEEDKNLVYFDPPLWRQRRSFVNEVLRESKVTSVVDFGCGEGSLLSFLIQPFEESPITRLAGVDINREIAEQAVENCRSIDIADKRFLGFDALVCMEVVEHVDPPVLDKFFDIVLGTYKPKIVIVTTPNTIALNGQERNFKNEYTGVGKLKYGDPAVGNVTQIAIFRDLNPSSKPLLSSFDTYEHIEKIDFPYYNEPDKSYEEILETIHYYLQFLCNRIIDTTNIKNDQQHEPNRIKIEEIWDIHRIRQLCKTKDKLRDVLSPNYNNDDQNWVTTTTNTAITTNGWPDYIGDYDSGWGDEGK
ncbi:19205_t:CDS:2 [Rhizophagus irregularis]|nr:19205_t:CDS:2 [Rhizophagus irregularis]